VALTTREIPREEWRTFFDDFSRDLGAMLAVLEVDGRDVGAQIEAERSRLTGITYDDGDDIVVIGLAAPGDASEDLEHIVDSPQRIFLASDAEQSTFDIEDGEGRKTLLRLQPVA
jgi:hypothetical protein